MSVVGRATEPDAGGQADARSAPGIGRTNGDTARSTLTEAGDAAELPDQDRRAEGRRWGGAAPVRIEQLDTPARALVRLVETKRDGRRLTRYARRSAEPAGAPTANGFGGVAVDGLGGVAEDGTTGAGHPEGAPGRHSERTSPEWDGS